MVEGKLEKVSRMEMDIFLPQIIKLSLQLAEEGKENIIDLIAAKLNKTCTFIQSICTKADFHPGSYVAYQSNKIVMLKHLEARLFSDIRNAIENNELPVSYQQKIAMMLSLSKNIAALEKASAEEEDDGDDERAVSVEGAIFKGLELNDEEEQVEAEEEDDGESSEES